MQENPRRQSAKMVRKQLLLTPEQNRRLRAHAQARGCPEAELIRAAIDKELGVESMSGGWKARMLACAGSLAREHDLERNLAGNRARWIARTARIQRKPVEHG